MSLLDAGVRGGGVALLLLLAALLLRDARQAAAARYAAAFVLSAAADLVGEAPAFDHHRSLWLAPLRLLGAGSPALFWVTTSALFDDDFEAGWPHLAAWLGLMALALAGSFGVIPGGFLARTVGALFCVGLALWTVLNGRPGDLDEARRRLRVQFVVFVGLFSAATIGAGQLPPVGGAGGGFVAQVNAIGNLALAFFFGAALLSLTPGTLLAPLALPPAARTSRAAAAERDDPREAPLMAALNRLMHEERAYRDESLGIAALAARLGVPEYRLRRLINQRLGHRNFAAFLNGYRLDETQAALADPTQTAVPVLTIALDAGFASLGPFNRAFKARTGLTPTEYRTTANSSRG